MLEVVDIFCKINARFLIVPVFVKMLERNLKKMFQKFKILKFHFSCLDKKVISDLAWCF